MSEQQPSTPKPFDDVAKHAGTDDTQAEAGAPVATTAPGRRRRFRPLRLLLALVLQLLILILLLLGFVLGTQTGLRAAIAVAEDLAPEMIHVDSVDGRVLGELRLQGLRLNLPGLALNLGHLHLDWSPGALFGGTLRIADLSASDIDIVADPGPEKAPESEPFELPQIQLPIGLDIERVLVERLSFNQTGAAPEAAIRLERAELSATALGDSVDLRRLDAKMAQPEVAAAVKGNARLTGDYPIDLDLDWQFKQAPALALSGTGKVTGDLAALHVTHHITGSADVTLDADLREVLSAPSWNGNVRIDAVRLPDLVADAPSVNVRAELKTEGNLDQARLTGHLAGDAPESPDFGKLGAELDLGWSAKILAIDAFKLNETLSGAMLDLAGTVDLNGAQPAFVLAGVWERLRWPLTGAALAESPQGKLDVDGDLEAFRYALTAQAFGEQIPETSLTLTGTGDTAGTKLEQLLLETLGGRIEGKGNAAWSPALTWDLALNAADIDPGLQWAGLDGKLALKADTSGGLDDGFDYKVKLDAALPAYPAAVVNLTGTGTGERARLDSLNIETLGGVVDGSGDIAWAPALTWDLTLNANDLDPGRQYPGLDGRIALDLLSSGGLEQGFSYSVKGNANLAAYPPAVLDIVGTGGADSTKVETLAVQLLGGRIDGSAEVAWAPELGWDTALTAQDIDPGKLLADWPGRIGGRIESSGKVTPTGPDLTARIVDLGGDLRGYPVKVDADAAVRGKAIELRQLQASSGATRLSADGSMTDQLDFRFDFSSPDLGTLLPDAKGRLSADGRVGGTLAAPSIALSLDGRDVEVTGQGIQTITGRADVGLGEGGAFKIDIKGANLIAGGQRFEALSIQGNGSMAAHKLEVNVDGEVLSLALGTDGALADAGAYSGSLQQLALTTQEFGTWSLQRPARFGMDQGRVTAGPLCISNGNDSGACAAFEQQQPGRFDVSLDAERIGLEILNPLLPEATVMNGFVRAKAKFRGEGSVLTGGAQIQLPTGEIEVVLPDAKDKLVFSGTGVDLRATGAGLNATLAVPLEGVGRIDGKVSVPGFSLSGGADPSLRGAIEIRLTDLSRISNLVPDLTDITGAVNGDIDLSGTLGKPNISGALALSQVGLKVPLIGLVVSETNLSVESRSANSLTVDGGALVGGGQLTVNGSAQILEQGLSAKVNITGDKLKVADSKEYFALLSTNLKAGVGPAGASVQGEIVIPQARIMPRTIPSGAIQPSADVVIEEPAAAKEAVPMHIDVLAKLGDKVSIEAFGLRGLLQGNLRITKVPNKGIVGDGQLEVVDGTYRVSIPGMGLVTAIGKPLTIKQGIVVFAKTPIDNPGLILNAVRDGGDVTAGVRVLGTIKNPKLAFFSESDPDLTQSQITTYLVTGVPPKRGASKDEQAVSVGTYVAPKLFMEYESSLGEQSDKVKMRYELTKSIEVQTETGDSQGADVFFKFEN